MLKQMVFIKRGVIHLASFPKVLEKWLKLRKLKKKGDKIIGQMRRGNLVKPQKGKGPERSTSQATHENKESFNRKQTT